jgi:hypothetical protein
MTPAQQIQQIQGILGVATDGDFGPNSQANLNLAIGNAGLIKQIQAILGVTQDGQWGPISNAALQHLVNAQAGGYDLIADGNHNDPWPPPPGMPAFIHKVSEGTFFTDPYCEQRMKAYQGKRGFYHFSSGDDPTAQARYFLAIMNNIGYLQSDLICLDFEESSRPGDSNMTAAGRRRGLQQLRRSSAARFASMEATC